MSKLWTWLTDGHEALTVALGLTAELSAAREESERLRNQLNNTAIERDMIRREGEEIRTERDGLARKLEAANAGVEEWKKAFDEQWQRAMAAEDSNRIALAELTELRARAKHQQEALDAGSRCRNANCRVGIITVSVGAQTYSRKCEACAKNPCKGELTSSGPVDSMAPAVERDQAPRPDWHPMRPMIDEYGRRHDMAVGPCECGATHTCKDWWGTSHNPLKKGGE